MLIIELLNSDAAQCGDHVVAGKKDPASAMARKLVGCHDFCEVVRVVRNGTLVFRPIRLWALARMTVAESVNSSATMTRYRSNPLFERNA
mgnify:CR=1 FL=1